MREKIDPGTVTALCNLLAAVSTTLISAGNPKAAHVMLSFFETMNRQTIGDERALAEFDAAIYAQRAILAQLGVQ